ncbi:hypothetical protein [Methanosarcina sp. 2.H.T.1A.15]|uniref:hypothetical protein n=1 Tax=Methanosarcina sp. 2.H.T.1A.15 TaxID=1483596 RepID=UPI0006229AB4|nr:hypothetical protein [Methanosarcina sp. 2.H.T.1A.15]KKG10831.1 hypothetical protein EO97_05975 [Methanosarcina sp. 2.H.T.1A.15]
MSRKIISKVFLICLLGIISIMPTVSAEDLPESDHNYANNFVYTWPAISDPDATQMRFHLSKLDLADDYSDKLIILDENGNKLKTYNGQREILEDVWTEWYAGNTFKIRLETDTEVTGYGFKIDQVETRTDMAPSGTFPESDHNYANNFVYTWPAISDPDATQMRFHLSKLDLADDYSDKLIILDENGNKLKTYNGQREILEDVWTEWYAGNTFKIRLETDTEVTGYGFKIDQVEIRGIDGETRGIELAEESSEGSPATIKTVSSTVAPVEFSVIESKKSSETAPEINIEVTKDQSSSDAVLFLSGSALSDSGIKSVTVNGIYVGTESWNVPLDLSTGDNTNVIVATGYDGSTTIETINIYNPDPSSEPQSSSYNSYLVAIISGIFVVIAAVLGPIVKKKLKEKENSELQDK